MHKFQHFSRFAQLILFALIVTLSVSSVATAQPQAGGILRIAWANDPLTLDSRNNMGTGGITTAYQVQEGLVTTDLATGEAAPGLAHSWDVSEDGLTYTFYLREGVTFHNGQPFSSADVVYTFEFVTGERPGGIYVSQFGPFIESIAAPDDYTFVVTLTTPWEDFLISLHRAWAFLILSSEAVETAGDAYGTDVMVGTGPFRFVSWERGERLVLERNPDYWNDPLPYLDGIEFQLVREGTVRVINARTGAADIAFDPPLDQLQALRGDPSLEIISVPGNPMISIQFNTRTEPFNDARLRRAVYHALDREMIVDAQYGEFADVATDILPSWHWLHDPDNPGVAYNPERARELLSDAGYGPGNPLAVEFMITTDSEDQELGVIVQAQLAAVGINVTLRTVESATRIAIIAGRDGQDPDQYKAAIWQQTLPGSITDDYLYKFYASDGTLNRTFVNQEGGHTDSEIERLINEGRTAPNREAAWAAYRQAIELLEEAAVLIPITYKQNVNLLNTRVQDFTPIGTNSFPLTAVWLQQ